MPYIGQSPSKGDENNFKILDDISSYTLTFDGTDASVVSAANDTITSLTHRFVQGQRVTYNKGSGGTVIPGLSDGVYYIIKHDHHNIKLATSASNATNGTAVNITGVAPGGSSHTLNAAFDGVNTKFKATHTNGQKAKITRSAQLVISINGVIQQPHDTATPSTGFGFDLDGTIVLSQAPAATDEYWAHVLTNNNVTFDISDNDIDNFTGNGSTTEFNLSKSPPDNRNVLVTIDGVVQYPNDPDGTARAYVVVENVLTFNIAPASGVEIQVRHIGFAGSTSGSGGVTNFYGRTGSVVLKSTDNVTVNDAAITGNSTVTGNLTVDGNFTTNGDFTTLNTTLREVELLHVDATSSASAGIITQRGSGDILNLFDNNSEVLTVTDGGQVGINSITPSNSALIDIGIPTTKTGSRDATVSIASTENKTYPTASSFSVTLGLKQEFEVGGTQTIDATTPGGFNFITGITNWMRKKNGNVQDVERSYYSGINQNFSWNDANTLKQYVGISDSVTYFGNDANGRTTSFLGAKDMIVNPGAGKTQTINIAQGDSLNFRNFDAGTTKTVNVTNWQGFNPNFSFFTIGGAIQGTTTNAAFYDTASSWGFNGSGSISYTVTNLYGLRLRPPTSSTGLTVTNNYGISQEWSSAKNYFAGKVGVGVNDPEAYQSSSNNLVVGNTGDAAGITIRSGSTNGGYITFANAGSGSGLYKSRIAYDHSGDSLSFSTNGQNRFFIKGSGAFGTGQVGINTATPDQTLEIFKPSGTNLVKVSTEANSTVGIEIEKTGSTTQSWRIVDGQTANGKLEFYDVTDSATRMIIDGSGKIGVGTVTPSKEFQVSGTIFASGATPSLDGGIRISPNNSGTSNGGVIYGGAYNDNNHAIFMRRGQDGLGSTVDINSYATFRIFTGGALASQTERLRITNDGFTGIGTVTPNTGLSIGTFGDYSNDDTNTYWQPEGKWISVWNNANDIQADTDYWVGYNGGYHKSGQSVNICLAPNRGNLTGQQGMYIAGEGTAAGDSDITFGKIVGGNTLGRDTTASSGKRATKVELLRIDNDGKVGIGTTAVGSQLSVGRASGNAPLTLDCYGSNRNRIIFRNSVVRGTQTTIEAHNDDLRLVVNSGNRLNITSAGNVGVAVTNPSTLLHVLGAGNQRQDMLRLQHTGQRNFYIQGQWGSTDVGGSNGILQYIDAGHLAFRVGSSGAADMLLDQNGKVGIQTNDPKAEFHARYQVTTNASTTFGSACGQILENEDSEFAFGLQNSNPHPLYIQGRQRANTNGRDICINPAGGAVAVGTNNSFSRKLTVKGTIGALSPSQTTALDFEADDGQNTYISSYHASGANLYIRTNYSGVGVQNRVHINGSGQFDTFGTSAGNPIGITITNTNTNAYSHARLRLVSQNGASASNIYTDHPNTALRLEYNGSNSVYIKQNGYVGITTSNPGSALHVRGAGGIRIDPLGTMPIVQNENVLNDGAGNPYLSGTPWYTAGTYTYDSSNNSPAMDYFWIKIVESLGYSTIAYIEYMCHSDSNYPRSVHGRIDVAKYANSSISISHQTITPQTGITPELVIDSNKRVWIRMNGAQWNSDFRFRVIYGESININSDFTIGTDNNSAATGRMLNQDATPLNASGIIESGATMRWDLSNSNPPKYWSGGNTSTTAGTYGDSAQTYSSGQAKFMRLATRGRVDIKADHQNHGLLVDSNYIGVNNPAQPVLAAFKSQKSTTLQLDRMYSHGEILQFKQNSSNVGYFSVTGTTSTHTSTGSDIRLKKDIEDWTEEVLPYFKSLKPQKFRFNSEDETAEKTKGYMAQDNLDKFPEAYPLNSQDDRYWFAPQHMVPYLMKALQEEIVKREEIEAKYNALEARISALEGS